MRIGVPKEIKVREYRVGLVPADMRELCARGLTADTIALGPPLISTIDEMHAMGDGLRRAIRHVMAQH